ncbi:MAG: ring-cleaving dioxygenase [Balneolaceae bacterium]|nr:ring-cleaving dioxygenase [Balneolaceae bacterium]
MADKIKGLHHITAVSGPPEVNYDFYTRVLGLRFTKKTINFDDPGTYHLYYGNYEATPGSSITFFPWQGVPQGVPKSGEATVVSYAVPRGSIGFWRDHFKKQDVEILGDIDRFGDLGIRAKDIEGMTIEIVESEKVDQVKPNETDDIPNGYAIRGFYGTTLSLADVGRTAELLQEFGWKKSGEESDTTRFLSEPENHLGAVIDLKQENLNGVFGRGSVHHIAFRVPDDDTQLAWRKKLKELGFNPTPVQDRQYFRSVYFREPGGVLFEIATDIPGFTKDEELENLGTELKLPPWYEKHREEIESNLVSLEP